MALLAAVAVCLCQSAAIVDLDQLLDKLEHDAPEPTLDRAERAISSSYYSSYPSYTICTCCNKVSNRLTGLNCCRNEPACFLPSSSSSYYYSYSSYY